MRDGDYYGPAREPRGAAHGASAHGGQIVVLARDRGARARRRSRPVVDLVDLGDHRLRDLDRPERVFQVARRRAPRRLPAAAVARRASRATCRSGADDVRRSRRTTWHESPRRSTRSRVVTLTGVGGVGKTRLALQVAVTVRAAITRTARGSASSRPRDEPTAVAAGGRRDARRCRSAPACRVAESVVDFLQDQATAPRRSTTASTCSTRCGELVGTIIRDVPDGARPRDEPRGARRRRRADRPAAIPRRYRTSPPTTTRSLASDAVRLFVDRATAAEPDFALESARHGAVAEICRRLDGIPLAIELAAARVGRDAPDRDRARARRTVPAPHRRAPHRRCERHQTLRATVDWSYSLLDVARSHRVRPARRVRGHVRRRRGGRSDCGQRHRAVRRARRARSTS